MGSFDTTVLLRYVLADVPEQSKRIDQLLAAGGTYAVSDLALTEMVFVLEKVYGLSRSLVVENILVIVLNTQFACNAGLFEAALQEYRDHPALSFIDCLLTMEAGQRGEVPLYTFDKALAKKLSAASLIAK